MIDKLIQLMTEQKKHLKQLLELLKIQKNMIIKKDAFGLEGLVDKLGECSRIIAKEEVERRKLLNNGSIKEFIRDSNNEELATIYKEISNTLNEVCLQKETNDMLIKQQISLNAKLLEIINPDREMKTYNSYGNISGRY